GGFTEEDQADRTCACKPDEEVHCRWQRTRYLVECPGSGLFDLLRCPGLCPRQDHRQEGGDLCGRPTRQLHDRGEWGSHSRRRSDRDPRECRYVQILNVGDAAYI